jgi:hypothetical protein
MSSALVDRSEKERKVALRRHPVRKQTAGDRWAKRIWQKYGLTPDDVAQKWAEQDGKCPICDADLTTKRWVVDHDHHTGRFRGLLCSWDNHRVVSMAERGGYARAEAVIWYLWPDQAARAAGF